MNNLLSETVVTLQQACTRYPGWRGAKHKHPSTLTRYILKGARSLSGHRVKLEAVRDSGRFLTSLEALDRFHAALSVAAPAPQQTQSRFDKDADLIEGELERIGAFKREK